MKPFIHKVDGKWVIRYAYHPRSFDLFGATGDVRKWIFANSVEEKKCDSWYDSITTLKYLYIRGEVRRHGYTSIPV